MDVKEAEEIEERKTKPEELEKYRKILPKEIAENRVFIPFHGKCPDVPKGESWKDEKYWLDFERAIERPLLGFNLRFSQGVG